jgi:hypothetical protein
MTKEQRDAAVRLITQYEQMYVENVAMKALLDVLQKKGAFKNMYEGQEKDSTWQQELDQIMKGPACKNLHQSFLPTLQQLEQSFQDAEFSRWLVEHRPKGPVN